MRFVLPLLLIALFAATAHASPYAVGGVETNLTNATGFFYIHTFTSNGTLNFTAPYNVIVLVVAGGGGGGGRSGGGGGGGGIIYNTSYSASGNVTVVVGAGGTGSADGGYSPCSPASNGTNSSFGTLIANRGGGGGAGDGSDAQCLGQNGGSGGGAKGYPAGSAIGNGTSGQGYNGGTGLYGSDYCGGGGGGSGAVGTNSGGSVPVAGGAATSYSINGTAVNYSKGGSSGCYFAATTGISASANTGNGGGGAGGGAKAGGNGGSGIVIIAYGIPPTVNTPVIAPSPANTSQQLNCSAVCTGDGTLYANFTWYLAGVNINNFNTQVSCTNATTCYTNKNMSIPTTGGENWTCSAMCTNGPNSDWSNSSTITITGAGTGCNETINMTKAMTTSSFNNYTNQSGCVVNLTVSVTNASHGVTHTCSSAGSNTANTTADYCQTNFTTSARSACTHSEDLAWDTDVTDAAYPCNLAITGYDDTTTFNLTKTMTDSYFNNLTTGTGCEANLTIGVTNASQSYTHACSAGGTIDTNSTYDYAQFSCTTNPLAACTYNQTLQWGDSILNTTYACNLDVSCNATGPDVVLNLSKTMTSSAFNNLTNNSGCVVNLTVGVSNGSVSKTHSCSAAGSNDAGGTYDYCKYNFTTNGMAACTYHPYETQVGETVQNRTYPCDLEITRNETYNMSAIAQAVWSFVPARTLSPDVWTAPDRALTDYNTSALVHQLSTAQNDSGFKLPELGGMADLANLWPILLILIGVALLGFVAMAWRRYK